MARLKLTDLITEMQNIPTHIISGAVEKCMNEIDEAVKSQNDYDIASAIIKYLNEKYIKNKNQ